MGGNEGSRLRSEKSDRFAARGETGGGAGLPPLSGFGFDPDKGLGRWEFGGGSRDPDTEDRPNG